MRHTEQRGRLAVAESGRPGPHLAYDGHKTLAVPIAQRRIFGHRDVDKCLHMTRYVGRQQPRIVADLRERNRDGIVAIKRASASETFVADDAQRVDVARRDRGFAFGLLRCEILRRTERQCRGRSTRRC